METKYKRIKRIYCQTIHAAPEVIFPLLCPVKEVDWLDGWEFKMIFSGSGLAEKGAVFTTAYNGEEDTVWLITQHNKINYKVEFVRVTPGSRASILNIEVKAQDDETSNVHISYEYTATSDLGNKFIDEFTEETFLKAVKFWEESMNYYLRTGSKLLK